MTTEQWINIKIGQFNSKLLQHKLEATADHECDLFGLLPINFYFIRCFLTLDKQRCTALLDTNSDALEKHLIIVNRLWSFKILLLQSQTELRKKCQMLQPKDILNRLLEVNKLLPAKLVTYHGFIFLIKYNLIMFVRHQMEKHRCHALQFWYENILRLITRARTEKDYSPIVQSIQSKIGDNTLQGMYSFMHDLLDYLDEFSLLDDVHSELAKIAIKLLSPQKNTDNHNDAATPTTPIISPKRIE